MTPQILVVIATLIMVSDVFLKGHRILRRTNTVRLFHDSRIARSYAWSAWAGQVITSFLLGIIVTVLIFEGQWHGVLSGLSLWVVYHHYQDVVLRFWIRVLEPIDFEDIRLRLDEAEEVL